MQTQQILIPKALRRAVEYKGDKKGVTSQRIMFDTEAQHAINGYHNLQVLADWLQKEANIRLETNRHDLSKISSQRISGKGAAMSGVACSTIGLFFSVATPVALVGGAVAGIGLYFGLNNPKCCPSGGLKNFMVAAGQKKRHVELQLHTILFLYNSVRDLMAKRMKLKEGKGEQPLAAVNSYALTR